MCISWKNSDYPTLPSEYNIAQISCCHKVNNPEYTPSNQISCRNYRLRYPPVGVSTRQTSHLPNQLAAIHNLAASKTGLALLPEFDLAIGGASLADSIRSYLLRLSDPSNPILGLSKGGDNNVPFLYRLVASSCASPLVASGAGAVRHWGGCCWAWVGFSSLQFSFFLLCFPFWFFPSSYYSCRHFGSLCCLPCVFSFFCVGSCWLPFFFRLFSSSTLFSGSCLSLFFFCHLDRIIASFAFSWFSYGSPGSSSGSSR